MWEGANDGSTVGGMDGVGVGSKVGRSDGSADGNAVGNIVGSAVGLNVGSAVGRNDGVNDARDIFLNRNTLPSAFPTRQSKSPSVGKLSSEILLKSYEQKGAASAPTSNPKKSPVIQVQSITSAEPSLRK
jgi:hypothetical protein